MFLVENDRLTIQPTNNVIFIEKSFTINESLIFPKGLKTQTEIFTSE